MMSWSTGFRYLQAHNINITKVQNLFREQGGVLPPKRNMGDARLKF